MTAADASLDCHKDVIRVSEWFDVWMPFLKRYDNSAMVNNGGTLHKQHLAAFTCVVGWFGVSILLSILFFIDFFILFFILFFYFLLIYLFVYFLYYFYFFYFLLIYLFIFFVLDSKIVSLFSVSDAVKFIIIF